MFDLEKSITDWRKQMLDAGIKTPVPLDELETHLREEMEKQIQSGVDPKRAFDAAVRKIGPGSALEKEFRQAGVSDEIRERKWKLFWISVSALCYAAPIVLGSPQWSRQLNHAERWLAAAAFVLTILSLFSGLVIGRFLPVILNRRARIWVQVAILVPGLIWLCAFAFVLLPRLEFTVGQLFVTVFWALCPVAVASGAVFGLDEAAWRRTLAANS